MRRRAWLVAASLAILAWRAAAQDAPAPSLFRGSDGRFDASGFLATRGGFLPVPLIITEPAIGYGGGLGAVVFRGGNPLARDAPRTGSRAAPPSIYAGAAFATENGSKGGAAIAFGVLRDDRIRSLTVAAAAGLELEYFGPASRPLDDPLEYGVDGALVLQRLLFRVKESPLMLGGEVSWSRQSAEFHAEALPPEAPALERRQDDAGIGAVAEYETLDNLFTARRGMKARVVAKVFSEQLGGDNDRQTAELDAFGYIPARERLTIGLRTNAWFSDGETPFYLLPFLKMRGLPALRYAGKHVILGETEARWQFDTRWSVVGFAGIGHVAETALTRGDSESVAAAGGGFRYLLAERLGIHVGVDYGQGPDEGAIYLIMGSAWR